MAVPAVALALTQGKTAFISPADLPRVQPYRWHLSHGYACTKIAGRTVYLHRLLLDAQPGQMVDHIDGDKLHNTRANLRLVSPQQNQQNRRSRSGFKGVSYADGKWRVRLMDHGQSHSLGAYDSLLTAALVYDAAARQLFGPYARTNLDPCHMTAEVEALVAARFCPPEPVPWRPSPYRGVSWERGRWRVRLTAQGVTHQLGSYATELAAAQRYDACARELLGAQARLNFPDAGSAGSSAPPSRSFRASRTTSDTHP